MGRRNLGCVLLDDPEVANDVRIHREDDALRRHPPHLGEAASEIVPVMDRVNGKCGIGTLIQDGELFGDSPQCGGEPGGSLPDHRHRRFDSHHSTAFGFIGPSAGTHVHNLRCTTECLVDRSLDTSVGTTHAAVTDTEIVVQELLGHGREYLPATGKEKRPRHGAGAACGGLPSAVSRVAQLTRLIV